jgi:hypothetical protein
MLLNQFARNKGEVVIVLLRLILLNGSSKLLLFFLDIVVKISKVIFDCLLTRQSTHILQLF